jgi:hypothetical protein
VDRKVWLLTVLLLVWVGAVVYAWNIWPEDRHAPLKYAKGQPVAATAIRRTDGTPAGGFADLVVHNKQLMARPQPPTTMARDLFVPVESFRPKPPPPPPRPRPAPPPPPPRPPTPEELAAMKAKQDLAQFRYMGYLDKGGGKDQAFLSRNGESMAAQAGETVQGHFYIKTISPVQVVIVELGTKLEMTLSLSQ